MELHEHDSDPSMLPSVGEWPSFTIAREHSLVVLASGRACWILESPRGFSLHVQPDDEASIREELALYQRDRATAQAKRRPVKLQTFEGGKALFVIWCALLLTVYYFQGQHRDWLPRFSNSAYGLIERHEWWRPFTALFLHANLAHLMGNVLVGGMFCLLVANLVGAWRSWLWILSAGILANATDAWMHYPDRFESIGASTATFAALGILVGFNTRLAWRLRSYAGLKQLIFPLAAGLALLGWFGTSGANTDVAAHFLGAAFGAVIALIFASPKPAIGDTSPKAARRHR